MNFKTFSCNFKEINKLLQTNAYNLIYSNKFNIDSFKTLFMCTLFF